MSPPIPAHHVSEVHGSRSERRLDRLDARQAGLTGAGGCSGGGGVLFRFPVAIELYLNFIIFCKD